MIPQAPQTPTTTSAAPTPTPGPGTEELPAGAGNIIIQYKKHLENAEIMCKFFTMILEITIVKYGKEWCFCVF